jgi:hypothetical protein
MCAFSLTSVIALRNISDSRIVSATWGKPMNGETKNKINAPEKRYDRLGMARIGLRTRPSFNYPPLKFHTGTIEEQAAFLISELSALCR